MNWNYIFYFVLFWALLFIFSYWYNIYFISKVNVKEKFKESRGKNDPYAKLYEIVHNYVPKNEQEARLIREKTGINENKRSVKILDIDVNTGHLAKYFKDLPKKSFVGVSKNEDMLAIAKTKNPMGEYLKVDLTNQKVFEPLEFTQVIALDEAMYQYNPELRKIVLKNIYHWLKPNGWFITNVIENPEEYNPGPREYTSYIIDTQDNTNHAITHFHQFSHDLVFDPDVSEGELNIHETFEFSPQKKYEKKYKLYVDDKIMSDILDTGFTLTEIGKIDLGKSSKDIYFFQKKL